MTGGVYRVDRRTGDKEKIAFKASPEYQRKIDLVVSQGHEFHLILGINGLEACWYWPDTDQDLRVEQLGTVDQFGRVLAALLDEAHASVTA